VVGQAEVAAVPDQRRAVGGGRLVVGRPGRLVAAAGRGVPRQLQR